MQPEAQTTSGRRLDGQVAVITGGAQGIGRAMALAFARAGAHVAIVDRRLDLAREAEEQIQKAGGIAMAGATDVTNSADVAALFAGVMERYQRVDLLVNCAGICPVTRFPDLDLAAWQRVFSVNVEGPLLTTREAASLMARQEPHSVTGCRGKIINVSSPAAEVGRPMFAAYGASKAALNHLSKTSALVLGDQLIATTVLYPGSVMGPLWEALLPDLVKAEGRDAGEILAERTAGMPLGRFQLPEETAAMALYIAAMPGMSLNGRIVWSEAHVAPL
jgi:meso-butanediol dehydrogenase/(S,S)-butanediol dehydrogenase/diacetyl reductase